MTQLQADAHLCGIVPEEVDPCFFAKHFAPYVFIAPKVAGQRVLEIGIGSGYGTKYLADRAKEVMGVDLVVGNIHRAYTQYQQANLHFLPMDATQLAFEDQSFDVACSFQVIEHIPESELERFVSEIARVLKPGGVFYVTTLNLAHGMKPGQPYPKSPYHEKEFTAPELECLLRLAFPVIEMYGLHLTLRHRFFQRLKKSGLCRWLPSSINPVERYYARITTDDFFFSPRRMERGWDLLGICRTVS